MKYVITSLLSMISFYGFSQNCDCNTTPTDRKCKEECAIKLLETGTGEQLKKVFHLDETTVQKIVNVPGRGRKVSVEDFQDDLSYKRYIILVEAINNWEQENTNTNQQETLYKIGGSSPLGK